MIRWFFSYYSKTDTVAGFATCANLFAQGNLNVSLQCKPLA